MNLNGTQFLLNDNQKQQLDLLLKETNNDQLIWLSGYFAGLANSRPVSINGHDSLTTSKSISENGSNSSIELSVLVGSRTGNGTLIAQKLKDRAEQSGIKVKLKDLNEYQPAKIKDEKNVLVIVSTHGEGVPPLAAEEFYNYVHSKKAPNLSKTKFSVLALGDKSYLNFCKTGKDIDFRLESLGAERVAPRTDCDIEFEKSSDYWIDEVLKKFTNSPNINTSVKLNGHAKGEKSLLQYTKQNPFPAKLLDRIKLSGKGSGKETFHIELSVENSGLQFAPGDALGVYATNSDNAVVELIEKLELNPEEKVESNGQTLTLKATLKKNFEITVLTQEVVTNYNKILKRKELDDLLANTDLLKNYLFGRDVLDLFLEYPSKITATEILNILRKLYPRLYSIASSKLTNPEEIHLTVSAVKYKNGRYKEGISSNFLAERVSDEENISVYIERNPEFRLPGNPDVPIIMIGPGTGVAPFRAFLQEREATSAKGKNWLFFGDRQFTTDFLYQTEWQSYFKKGLLTRMNVAFSRDTNHKVYVQHKMLEHSKELFQWIEEGAHLYVCGDMKSMWKDVNSTLLDIISKEAGIDNELAKEYVQKMKKEKRYQADVY
jgi:sulfite reductase (NADPH) flavoprotein alpha-component